MNKDIPWRFIISHLKGDVDEKEEKLFCEWLQEERNTLLFRELESLWREIREETSTYTPDTDYYWRQMESRMLRKDEKPKSVPLWKFWMAVSVATVLLVLSLTFSFLYNKSLPPLCQNTWDERLYSLPRCHPYCRNTLPLFLYVKEQIFFRPLKRTIQGTNLVTFITGSESGKTLLTAPVYTCHRLSETALRS